MGTALQRRVLIPWNLKLLVVDSLCRTRTDFIQYLEWGIPVVSGLVTSKNELDFIYFSHFHFTAGVTGTTNCYVFSITRLLVNSIVSVSVYITQRLCSPQHLVNDISSKILAPTRTPMHLQVNRWNRRPLGAIIPSRYGHCEAALWIFLASIDWFEQNDPMNVFWVLILFVNTIFKKVAVFNHLAVQNFDLETIYLIRWSNITTWFLGHL